MKGEKQKRFATCLMFVLCFCMLMPLSAFAQGDNIKIPKGYVDPVHTLGMKRGDVNVYQEFSDRLEEIYLVPYEANVSHFDSFLSRAEIRLFHPVSGAPLVIKRGEVIPEYRLDISYGPIEYVQDNKTIQAEVSGEYVMKNIQFSAVTEDNPTLYILHNVGGSYSTTDNFASTPSTRSVNLMESTVYKNSSALPEASYASAIGFDADDPSKLMLSAIGEMDLESSSPRRDIQVHFRVAGVKLSKGNAAAEDKASVTVDTRADKDKGETSVPIPETLAAIIFGGLAAAAGAGAGGGGSGNGSDKGRRKSRYKMCLRKDFGDGIRYDAQPVTVYARIVETTPEGEEIDRPDLTASLEIFSDGNLTVEGSAMAGNYMGALVSAESASGGQNRDTGILSIRFSGAEGSFQNNVTFRLIGEPYISLAGPNLSVLAGSGRRFSMPVDFVDFTEPPINIRLEGGALPITLEQKEDGSHYIEITDDTPKPETITKFYEEIPCTISADCGREKVAARFSVLKCYEGLLADFLGKANEIMAYKNEEGEMPVTNIGFQMGVWDENGQELNIVAPESMEVSYKDPDGIYQVIGLSYEQNANLSSSTHFVYSFTADKSLPSPNRIEGILSFSGRKGDLVMENETTIYLIPDLLIYARDFEQEYDNCLEIIHTYMSGEIMKRKADELYRDKHKLGLEDLKLYRQHCWQIASRMILQKKEDYLQDVYWHDEMIAYLELTVFVGDVAFSLALVPYTGPISAFLADNVKSTFLELCEEYVKKGDIMNFDILEEIIWNRFKQTIGSVDNFIGMPEKASTKQKIAWVCSYFLYRVFYRWFYDKDEEGNSAGLVAALENAAKDLATNRCMAYLGDYMKKSAQKHGIDHSKGIKAEEKAVKNALVGGFDLADEGAAMLDKAVEEIADFIKRIQVV